MIMGQYAGAFTVLPVIHRVNVEGNQVEHFVAAAAVTVEAIDFMTIEICCDVGEHFVADEKTINLCQFWANLGQIS
jgi:hypothetical protein